MFGWYLAQAPPAWLTRAAGPMHCGPARPRTAEARWRALVEQIPAITYIAELRRARRPCTWISPRSRRCSACRRTRSHADQDLWYGLIHPDDLERVMAEERASSRPARSSTSSTGWSPARRARHLGARAGHDRPRRRRDAAVHAGRPLRHHRRSGASRSELRDGARPRAAATSTSPGTIVILVDPTTGSCSSTAPGSELLGYAARAS